MKPPQVESSEDTILQRNKLNNLILQENEFHLT